MDYRYIDTRGYTIAKSATIGRKSVSGRCRKGEEQGEETVLRDGRWGIVVSRRRRRRREEDGRDRENKSTAPTCLLLAATLELDASTDVLKLRLKSCRQVLAGRGSSKIYLTESFLIFRREKSGSQATYERGRRRKGRERVDGGRRGERDEIANEMRENEPVIFILGTPVGIVFRNPSIPVQTGTR